MSGTAVRNDPLAGPRAGPPGPRGTRHSGVLALMSACVVLAVALVAAVNLALPKLDASALHPGPTQLVWIVDAYVLAFACLLIPAGALGDRRGRKGTLLAGLAVFAAGCVLAALAPDVNVLIAARALSGTGAALIMPATLSLAIHSAPPDRKAHAIAVWTAATGAAGMVGNLAGGLVLQYLPWQGLFWASAPPALLLLALTAKLAPRTAPSPGTAGPADPLGTTILVLASLALLIGIIEGPQEGWTSPLVLASFTAAALLSALFVTHGLRSARPLIDPRVFAAPRLRAGVLGIAATFFGLFALFYVNAQYLQNEKGYSPGLAGLAIAPIAIGMIVVSRYGPALVARWGTRTVVTAGMLCMAAGLALLSLLTTGTPYVWYAGILVLMSLGMGLCMPALSTSVLGSLPAERAGLGSGLNGAAREFGSALGVAAMGTVLAAAHGDFMRGMTTGFRVAAVAVAALGVLTVWWLREPRGREARG